MFFPCRNLTSRNQSPSSNPPQTQKKILGMAQFIVLTRLFYCPLRGCACGYSARTPNNINPNLKIQETTLTQSPKQCTLFCQVGSGHKTENREGPNCDVTRERLEESHSLNLLRIIRINKQQYPIKLAIEWSSF